MSENKDSNNLPTFISGIIIGAALTYIFGTKSGQKLKDQLLKEGEKLLEEMGNELENVREKIDEVEPAKKLEQAEQKVEEVKEEIQKEIKEVPQQIEEIQKKGRRFFFHKRPQSTTES